MTITLGARASAVIGSLLIIRGPFFPGTKHIVNESVHVQSYYDDATGDSILLIGLGFCCLLSAIFGMRRLCRGFAFVLSILIALAIFGRLFTSYSSTQGESYAEQNAWGMYVIFSGGVLVSSAVVQLRKHHGTTKTVMHEGVGIADASDDRSR